MLHGIPFVDPATGRPYDYENLSRQKAIELKHHHFKWSLLEEYDAHEWDGTFDPLYRMLKNASEFKWTGVSAGTSMGKTYMFSVLVGYFLTVHKAMVISVGVSFQSMIASIWAEVKNRWQSKDPNYGLQKLLPNAKVLGDGSIICDGATSEDAKWAYFLRAVKNEGGDAKSAGSLQGIHADRLLFLCDEQSKLAQSTMNAITNTCTGSRNGIIGAGNPDNMLDPLGTFMRREDVDAIRISALDFPDVVSGREIIGHGSVSRKSVERRRLNLGEDNPLFLSRVRGKFPVANQHAILKSEDFFAVCRPASLEDFGGKEPAFGIDVSSSENGDKASLAVMQGSVMTNILEFTCANAGAIAANLVLDNEELYKYLHYTPKGVERKTPLPDYGLLKLSEYGATEEDIIVDSVGLGESTVNAFTNDFDMNVFPFFAGARAMGGQYERLIPEDTDGKPLLRFSNLRTLAFFVLVFAIRNKEVVFNTDTISKPLLDQLYAELGAMKLDDSGSAGGLRLESKKKLKSTIGKSPNLADAVVMSYFLHRYNSDVASASGVYL